MAPNDVTDDDTIGPHLPCRPKTCVAVILKCLSLAEWSWSSPDILAEEYPEKHWDTPKSIPSSTGTNATDSRYSKATTDGWAEHHWVKINCSHLAKAELEVTETTNCHLGKDHSSDTTDCHGNHKDHVKWSNDNS